MLVSKTFHEAYPKILSDVLNSKLSSAPRGMEINEILNYSFTILDPTDPWTKSRKRRINYRFGILEGILNVYGSYPPDVVLSVNSQMKHFMNEEKNTWDGNYPERIDGWLKFIVKLLKEDPDSRRAVIPIYGLPDRRDSLDICCTETLQFFVREEHLHLVVNMRSNDAFLGTPNDVVQFMVLQNFMASWLGLPVGVYYHNAGSMHLYERNMEKAAEIVIEGKDKKAVPFNITFPKFPEKISYEESVFQIGGLVKNLRELEGEKNYQLIQGEPFETFSKILLKETKAI